jgi:ABC-type spermidine/putrescine transport system permease subunit II
MFNNYKGKWHNKRISEFDYNEQLEEQYTKAFKRFIIIAIVTLIVSIVFGILLSINDGRKNCMGIN